MVVLSAMFALGVTTAACWDLAQRRVPNMLNVAILAAGLAARAAMGGFHSLAFGVLGAAIGLGMLLVLFELRWIGGGDVKLVAAVGAWLGLDVFWAAALGVAGGGLLAAAITVAGGATLRAEVAANLKSALMAAQVPYAPVRAKVHLVPMAVAFAGAAMGVFFARGGLS